MTDRDVELLLERTAASMAYPATPQLRGRVLAAVARQVPQAPSPATRRPAFALATIAGAFALFAAMLALAIPTSRTAIADFFGIEGSKVERLPTPPPGTTATPFPTPADLPATARPATLDEIEAALGFEPALIDGDEPDASYLVQYGDTAVAILRYPQLDLWQAPPRGPVFAKGVPEDAIVLELTTPGGRDAYFIEGGEHIVRVVDELGVVPGSERTVARNTLIFSTGWAFYRIETDLPRSPELLAVADSLP